jgi:hypothetical protein
MQILIMALEDGTPTGKQLARDELMFIADQLQQAGINQ